MVKYFLLKWSHNTLVQNGAGKSDSYLVMRLCPCLGRYWMYFRILGSRYQLLTRSGLRDSRWWNDETARDTRALVTRLSRGPSRLRDSPGPGPAASHITEPRSQCCEDLHFLPPRQQPPAPRPIPRYQPSRSEIGATEKYLLCFMITSPRLPSIFRGSITCSCRMWAPCFIISRRKVLCSALDDK